METDIITNYDIQALLDNELPEAQINHVISHLEQNPQAKKCYEQLYRQKELLKLLYNAI